MPVLIETTESNVLLWHGSNVKVPVEQSYSDYQIDTLHYSTIYWTASAQSGLFCKR